MNDPQFSHWDIPIQNWWAQNSGRYNTTTWSQKPNDYDNIHTDYNKPIVSIVEPNIENIYPVNQKIELLIESRGVYPLSKIDIFINDVFVGTSNNPINFSFTPGELDNLKTLMKLK